MIHIYRKKLPPVAYDSWDDIRKRDDVTAVINQHNISWPYGELPSSFSRKIRQHYYAAVTYMDDQIGKVLATLNNSAALNNTIVIFWGDHGWQLGERNEWAKYSTCETATRVPLIVNLPPTSKYVKKGRKNMQYIDALVELVDIMPTVADLAGIEVPPICPVNESSITTCVEGLSFKTLLDPSAQRNNFVRNDYQIKNAVFSQYSRPADKPKKNTDMPDCEDITRMGYTMRTKDYRYTEWITFNCSYKKSGRINSMGDWNKVHTRELYLHNSDQGEDNNVAEESEHADLIKKLSKQLREGWRGQIPH